MATLRVTNLRGRTANVAPDLPDGANITGVCTATSFSGDGSSLTGIDATTIKDSGGTTRVQGNTSGIVVTGVSTFSDSANFSSGATVTGNVIATSKFRGNDDVKLSLGDSEDLQIYHNGSHSVIKDNGTGNLLVYSNNIAFNNAADTEAIARFNEDGSCEFYHDNSKKVETSATGITVTGTVAATSYTGDGSALTGIDAGVTTTSQYNQSGVITINLGTGQGHEVTLAAGISTITVTGGTAGASHHLIITQPSSGITTVGFSTYFLWPSGSPPNLSRSAASSETDMITFVVKQQTQTGTGVTQLLASAGIDYQ